MLPLALRAQPTSQALPPMPRPRIPMPLRLQAISVGMEIGIANELPDRIPSPSAEDAAHWGPDWGPPPALAGLAPTRTTPRPATTPAAASLRSFMGFSFAVAFWNA